MKATGSDILADAAKSLSGLIDLGTQLGRDMLDMLERGRAPMSNLGSLGNMGSWMSKRECGCACGAGQSGCGCKIPPACWEPICAGEITSHVCPASSATLRVRVTNCSAHAHDYRVEVPKGLSVTPTILTLGPMERGFVTISTQIPADATNSFEEEKLVWIRGCRHYYLRWTVKVVSRGAECCHEIEIEDCADTIHHWYDHFYCQHPCQH